MQKNKVTLEVEKNSHIYMFQCDPDSPLGEIYDVLSEIRSHIVHRMNEQEAAEKAQKEPKE